MRCVEPPECALAVAKEMMMDSEKQAPGQEGAEVPPDPEERAFTGHPDHPPASPDQSVEGNQELLRQGEDPADESGSADGPTASD